MPVFRIADIEDNPYFVAGAFQIHRKKIEALKESMSRTGAWGGWVARIGPNGKPQQAFGHHRKRAAQELFGDDYTIELVIDNVSDADMIRMMADENANEWEHDAFTTINTVKAVVQAVAAEHIRLSELTDRTRLNYVRMAPSYRSGEVSPAQEADLKTRKQLLQDVRTNPNAYTANTVATFLGWVTENGTAKHNVIDSLDALEFIEDGVVTPNMFSGLSIEQLSAVISEMRRHQDAHWRQLRNANKAVSAAQKRIEHAETEQERTEALQDLRTAQDKLRDNATVRQEAANDATAIANKLSEEFKNGKLSARNVTQVRTAISHVRSGDIITYDLNNLAGRLVKAIDKTFTDDKQIVKDLKTVLAQPDHIGQETIAQINQALHDASDRFLQYASDAPIKEPVADDAYIRPTPAMPQDAFSGRSF